jgi:hypothetical protein
MGQFFVGGQSLGLVAGGAAVKGCGVGTNGFSIAALRIIGSAPSVLHVHSHGLSTWAFWSPRFGMAAGTPLRHNPPRRIP